MQDTSHELHVTEYSTDYKSQVTTQRWNHRETGDGRRETGDERRETRNTSREKRRESRVGNEQSPGVWPSHPGPPASCLPIANANKASAVNETLSFFRSDGNHVNRSSNDWTNHNEQIQKQQMAASQRLHIAPPPDVHVMSTFPIPTRMLLFPPQFSIIARIQLSRFPYDTSRWLVIFSSGGTVTSMMRRRSLD